MSMNTYVLFQSGRKEQTFAPLHVRCMFSDAEHGEIDAVATRWDGTVYRNLHAVHAPMQDLSVWLQVAA